MRAEPPQHRQSEPPRQEITGALLALRGGAPDDRQDALERLVPLVYGELRKIAHRQLGAERAGHTLSTTALVHEAYLRLVDQTRAEWSDRAQFFAVAARAMRRILVDYARRHRALRRGGAAPHVPLDALEGADAGALSVAERADELVALDERLSRVVECRFFAGLSEAETAEVLGVTARTVARDWVKAKGWLYQELRPDGD